jgi:hypothetical protein
MDIRGGCMSDDRVSDKSVIDDNNYNVSIDGNCVHYYVLEDDYKITITVFPENTFKGTEISDETEEEGGEENE